MGLTWSHRHAVVSRGFFPPSTDLQPPGSSMGEAQSGAGSRAHAAEPLRSAGGSSAHWESVGIADGQRVMIPFELGQFIKLAPRSSNKLSL